MLTISNNILKVTIATEGAELQSVFNQTTGLEYLWDAKPIWPKRSPILFPVVGGLKDGSYEYEGGTYYFNRHGFAREENFLVGAQSETSVTLYIETTPNTRKQYPFDFKFSITYTLKDAELEVSYLVENLGDGGLYFSVGAHPAFNVPLVPGDSYTDYYLSFSETENAGIYPIAADGLIENTPKAFLINTNQLPLTKSLFYNDALIFKELKSTSISILNHKNPHGLTLSYPNFPYMGIWSAKDSDFVCIEPWCGLGDTESTTKQLQEKEGIVLLGAKEQFSRSWVLSTF